MQYWINLIGVPSDHLLPIADEAEQLGFAGLALADHLAVPTVIESPYPGGARPWTEAARRCVPRTASKAIRTRAPTRATAVEFG